MTGTDTGTDTGAGTGTDTDTETDTGTGARIAILMRTRDRPVLLARALASVLAQTHADWHLLLVNDGGAEAPVRRLVDRHATGLAGRITLIHHPRNLGMDAAARAALVHIDAATATHVAVHDDDDSWHPDFLACTGGFLARPEHRDQVAVMTRWTVVQERMVADGVVEDRRSDGPVVGPALEFTDLLVEDGLPPICMLTRRAALDRLGGFERSLPLSHPGQAVRLLLEGEIGVIPERLAFRHRRDADAPPAYANLSTADREGAALRAAHHRNTQMRALAQRDPAGLSLLRLLEQQALARHGQDASQQRLILANLDRNGLWGHARHEDLHDRLVRIEARLDEIAARPRGLRNWLRGLW